MFDNFQYAYLIGNFLIGFPLWLFLFIHRKDLRKEILISSLLIGILAPLWSPWFIKDYWHPESLNFWRLGAGDFFYGFFFGGIANVIYEEIFGRHYAKRKDRKHHWSWFILPFAALGVLVFTQQLSLIANISFVSNFLISLNLGAVSSTGSLNVLIAFFAGLVSFLSPSVLPLIPAFLAYLGSTVSVNEK